MGNVACCDNDVAPPDPRFSKMEKVLKRPSKSSDIAIEGSMQQEDADIEKAHRE